MSTDIVDRAYSSFKPQPGIGPLAELSKGLNVLELFHGKTLAFKDVSMCVIGQLLDYYLQKRERHVIAVVGKSPCKKC